MLHHNCPYFNSNHFEILGGTAHFQTHPYNSIYCILLVSFISYILNFHKYPMILYHHCGCWNTNLLIHHRYPWLIMTHHDSSSEQQRWSLQCLSIFRRVLCIFPPCRELDSTSASATSLAVKDWMLHGTATIGSARWFSYWISHLLGTMLNLRSLFAITSASTRKGRHCGFAIGYPEKFTLDYQFAPIFLTKPIPPIGNAQKTHTTHIRVQASTILHKTTYYSNVGNPQ